MDSTNSPAGDDKFGNTAMDQLTPAERLAVYLLSIAIGVVTSTRSFRHDLFTTFTTTDMSYYEFFSSESVFENFFEPLSDLFPSIYKPEQTGKYIYVAQSVEKGFNSLYLRGTIESDFVRDKWLFGLLRVLHIAAEPGADAWQKATAHAMEEAIQTMDNPAAG